MQINNVVLNSSPIISLSKSGFYHLLSELFKHIIITNEVLAEVTVKGLNDVQIDKMFSFQNIELASGNYQDARVAGWDLGKGETSVISYALENKEFYAVVDDMQARQCAELFGCKYIGTVAVIVMARRNELISSVREALFRIKSSGLWLSDSFIETVCKNENE
ncbi:MAG TPA: DUF3368 domain-containing protein [Desulfomonilia bacterium]